MKFYERHVKNPPRLIPETGDEDIQVLNLGVSDLVSHLVRPIGSEAEVIEEEIVGVLERPRATAPVARSRGPRAGGSHRGDRPPPDPSSRRRPDRGRVSSRRSPGCSGRWLRG